MHQSILNPFPFPPATTGITLEEFVSSKGGALEDWDHYTFLGNCPPTPPLANVLPLGRSKC